MARNSRRYPSSSSSLARRRSRSTTRDLVEILAIDMAEVFEGPRGPSGELVESLLVADEKYRAFLEHATPDVERQLLEDGDVEVDLRQVLEPLVARGESGRWGCGMDQAHVEVGAGRRLPRARLPKRITARTSGSRLAHSRSLLSPAPTIASMSAS